MASCCTCASLLDSLPEQAASEKPLRHRGLDCCGRVVCAPCLDRNPRFANYCPFCPTTCHLQPPMYAPSKFTEPPPPYTPSATDPHPPSKPRTPSENPPLTDSKTNNPPLSEKTPDQAPPRKDAIIHHLNHPHDSITSLSLKYNIPASVLRSYNSLPSDYLLAARRTIVIPPEYASSSLSPVPVDDPEEIERKAKIRRFMMTCKVVDYDLAVVYLQGAGWDVDVAAGRWVDDEVWERENPLKGKGKATETVPYWRRRWGR